METRTQVKTAGGLRGLAKGPAGAIVAVVLLMVAAALAWNQWSQKPVDTSQRDFICAVTGKPFAYEMKEGETYPVMSPYTKERTGYRAEKCYWTRDGKAKTQPTLVLLNQYLGKEGPTYCPDCGREVRPHNKLPPPELLREALEAEKKGGK